MLICIQGLGYVGAATAIVVSSVIKKNNLPKFQVVGIDLSTKNGLERIKKLNSGIFPFHTEDKNVQKQIKKIKRMGNFRASTSKEIYKKADVIIVSSNFDVDKNQRKISYNSFKKGIIDIAKRINEESLIIVQSTVPPGTCEKIVYPILRKFFLKRKLDVNKISIAHSYERVMPGKNYLDSIVNFWRVYSGINNQSAQKCKNFLSQVINVKDFPLTKLESTSASELS